MEGSDTNRQANNEGSMNKQLKLVGVLLFSILFNTSVMAATVGFDPNPKQASVGEVFTVDIVGSEFTIEQPLAGGTFDIGFDSTYVQINSVSIDPHWDFLPQGGEPTDGNVWIGVAFDAFVNDALAGDFTIATVNLTALSEGLSEIVILDSQLFSPSERLFPDLPPGAVVVPVPAALWLFGSGIIGLIGVARKHDN